MSSLDIKNKQQLFVEVIKVNIISKMCLKVFGSIKGYLLFGVLPHLISTNSLIFLAQKIRTLEAFLAKEPKFWLNGIMFFTGRSSVVKISEKSSRSFIKHSEWVKNDLKYYILQNVTYLWGFWRWLFLKWIKKFHLKTKKKEPRSLLNIGDYTWFTVNLYSCIWFEIGGRRILRVFQ